MNRITRTASTTLAAAALALTSVGAAMANEQGLADGWFDPTEPTVVTAAAESVASAPAYLCSGYEVGLPDGCWAGEGTLVAAGGITAAGPALVPDNVR